MEIVNKGVSGVLLDERLELYRFEASRHPNVGSEELYRWNCVFSGIVLSYTSLVEVYVRNSVDKALRQWAKGKRYADWFGDPPSREWFDGDDSHLRIEYVPDIISRLFNQRNGIEQAWKSCRRNYRRWCANPDHRRHGDYPDRNDAFSQFTFGSWTRLMGPVPGSRKTKCEHFREFGRGTQAGDESSLHWADDARELWKEALYKAFPNLTKGKVNDTQRVKVAKQLERVVRLRNRAAHGENMLNVRTDAYLDAMLSLLSEIDPSVKADMLQQTGNMYRVVARLKYQPEKLADYQRNDPSPAAREIVAYKITPDGSLPANKLIDRYLHCAGSEGKGILVSVGTSPQNKYRDDLDKILLVADDGSKAAVGDVVDYGLWDVRQPSTGFLPVPLERRRPCWFEVRGLYELDCFNGIVNGYVAPGGRTIPDAFGHGELSMRYVEHE